MKNLLTLQSQLCPDLLTVMHKRYEILRRIQLLEPVGRRTLTASLHLTERVLRSEVEFLRDQGLVEIAQSGMTLTDQGKEILQKLHPFIDEFMGYAQLTEELKQYLKIREIWIVSGDSDHDHWAQREMARAGAHLLKERMKEKDVIAVAGGSTMLALAESMGTAPHLQETMFVPARGGVGDSVEHEANYIASVMAKHTGGHYRMLHVPDQISEEAYELLTQESQVADVLNLLKKASILVYSIGEAKTMAQRRKSSSELIQKLDEKQAVGESFGYYFDRFGNIVHQTQTVGLRLRDLPKIEQRIAIAGGASKADAIAAICALFPQDTLVTDEAAARKILSQKSLLQK